MITIMQAIDALAVARWQFGVAWSLADEVHLPRLTTEMCLWQPDQESWTVRQDDQGVWRADWQDTDPTDPPAPSIGWLTWHLTWWWRNALVAVRGDRPDRVRGPWAGSAERVVSELRELAGHWMTGTASLNDATLAAPACYPWPDPRPLMYTIAWVNLELMKNVAEIGEVANMYAHRDDR